MTYIKSLGYIGVCAEDLEAWRTYAVDVLGLQVNPAPDGDDTLYLRMDGRAYRIAVSQGENGAVTYVGYEVASRKNLDDLAEELRGKGIAVVEEGPEVCAARRVAAMYSTLDPAGNRLEFFIGHEEMTAPFVSPTGAQFVIEDMGLGHCAFLVEDLDAYLAFYLDDLGFRLSDTISIGEGGAGHFIRCGPRHHTIACASVPGLKPKIEHIMLEVTSIDTIGRALDVVTSGNIPLVATLGKHTNDHMISFYSSAPNGIAFEYGIGGRRVDDDTWVVGHYTADSYWGHQRPVPA